jgi:hypothetical protein
MISSFLSLKLFAVDSVNLAHNDKAMNCSFGQWVALRDYGFIGSVCAAIFLQQSIHLKFNL